MQVRPPEHRLEAWDLRLGRTHPEGSAESPNPSPRPFSAENSKRNPFETERQFVLRKPAAIEGAKDPTENAAHWSPEKGRPQPQKALANQKEVEQDQ